jgi:predicted protein tyrosine phosphatase
MEGFFVRNYKGGGTFICVCKKDKDGEYVLPKQMPDGIHCIVRMKDRMVETIRSKLSPNGKGYKYVENGDDKSNQECQIRLQFQQKNDLKMTLVRVPQSSNELSFRRNVNRTKCVTKILDAIIPSTKNESVPLDNRDEDAITDQDGVVYCLFKYLGTKYADQFALAAKDLGIPVHKEKMPPATVAAMMEEAKREELSKHFEVKKVIADVNNQTKHTKKEERQFQKKRMKRSLIQMMPVIIRQHDWILTCRDTRERERE